ncbi:MHYT domain-containing protein [Actinocrispum sp. NPDC049592]|uniref:MHYT domain-containing protein n=1 Tax=Actinocrispum sp. NPDC049592 TaxID=3154835 RepID=UPI003417DF82
MGTWTLWLAYGVCMIGSLIGLSCTARARQAAGRRAKLLWTGLAAVAIGGVGIWLMHFLALLGFTVTGAPLRYSVGLTALSGLIAVVVVGGGLAMVTLAEPRKPRLAAAGILAGTGVACMHYLGMAAIQFRGSFSYDPLLVVLSFVIAIGATTAAFSFAVAVRTVTARFGAAALMGIAVTGMHFTGMSAVAVHLDRGHPPSSATDVFDLVFPVFVLSGAVIAGLMWALFTTNTTPEPARHARALLGKAPTEPR